MGGLGGDHQNILLLEDGRGGHGAGGGLAPDHRQHRGILRHPGGDVHALLGVRLVVVDLKDHLVAVDAPVFVVLVHQKIHGDLIGLSILGVVARQGRHQNKLVVPALPGGGRGVRRRAVLRFFRRAAAGEQGQAERHTEYTCQNLFHVVLPPCSLFVGGAVPPEAIRGSRLREMKCVCAGESLVCQAGTLLRFSPLSSFYASRNTGPMQDTLLY